MKRLLLKICFFLFSLSAVGQLSSADLISGQTVRDLSLGGAAVGTRSPLSLAGYGKLPGQIYAGYRNKFSVKELAEVSFAGLFRSSFMTNVISAASAGYADFRHTLFSVHAQKQLSARLSLGVALQSAFLSAVTLEQNQWGVQPAVGLEYQASKPLVVGLEIRNPVHVGSDEYWRLRSPFGLTAGASFSPGELYLLAVQYTWQEGGESIFRLGGEWALLREFKVRAGLSTGPFTPAFGCGYTFQEWTVDAAGEYHRYLGTSLSVGLTYHFKK